MLVQQPGRSVCQISTGDGREPAACPGNTGNVFILKIFLICRDEKWESGVVKTPGRSRRLFWRVNFSFWASDKQPDKRNHNC